MLQKNEIKIKIDFLEKEEKIISVYEEPANYVHVCPCCGSTEVVRNGTYERNIVFSKEGRISVKRVRMQRFLCKKCRRTRTHYPAFAVPGKEYSTGLLMAVVLGGKHLLEDILDISSGQIRELKRRYRETRKKLEHIIRKTEIETSVELAEAYEDEFLAKPFYPYQRDMYIKGTKIAVYTSF